MKINIKEHHLLEGWYAKPRLFCFTKNKQLTKSEYTLLDILFHLENRFNKEPNVWFHHDDEEICKTRLISPKTLIKARRSLKEKGLIDFKPGHSHRATEYKILIDGSFYFRGSSL
jgi:hypothetical protein